jgi:hypothetical protein
MRKYLLPETGNFYKANLHCHSTYSDGKLSPEELKRAYQEKGYSIIAYTDHDILIPHPELADENFLPLNSFEISIDDPKKGPFGVKRCCHLCCIALVLDNLEQPCWHRTKYHYGNVMKYLHLVKFDETEPDYEREYSAAGINDLMRHCREKGFFVTYNHPKWSMENYEQYMGFDGMNAFEICNYACLAEGVDDYNGAIYDDMLRGGKKLFCIAADDNHNHGNPERRDYDSFGGFTVIKAENLEYRTVTKALEAGNFYASEGPEIKALWFEDGKIHVECGAADRIVMTTGVRRCGIRWAENGELLTEAEFEVKPEYGYVRITVIDEAGRHADTNAYFTDELLEE